LPKLKGSIKKIEDLLLLIGLTKSGKVVLKLPYFNRSLILCVKNNKIYILNNLEKKEPEEFIQMFVEEWLHSSLNLFFENNPEESCPDNVDKYLTKEKLKELLTNPLLGEIKKLPKLFEITEVNSENIPAFLKFHYALKKPLTVQVLHSNNLTLIDFIKLLKSGSIRIEPVDKINSFPKFISVILSLVLVMSILLYTLPVNYNKFAILNLNKVENIVLRNKVLSKKIQTINGCIRTKYIFNRTRNSIILEDVMEKKLIEKKLPDKDYTPIFAIPEK
jgi:hypothetical protein